MKTRTKIGLVALGIIVALIAVAVTPAVLSYRVVTKLRACEKNIKQLNVALAAYAKDHGAYPLKLSDLYPKYVGDLNVFICPGNPKRIDNPGEIDSKGGYVLLLPGGSPSKDVVDDRPLLCDRRFNHRDHSGGPWGGTILCCDGHFMFYLDKRATNRWGTSPYTFDFPE